MSTWKHHPTSQLFERLAKDIFPHLHALPIINYASTKSFRHNPSIAIPAIVEATIYTIDVVIRPFLRSRGYFSLLC
jgi:hypothetical protein